MNKIFPTILFSILIFTGCKSNEEKESFTEKIEKGHQKEKFLSKQAIQYDFKLEFGSQEKMDAQLLSIKMALKLFLIKTEFFTLQIYQTKKEYALMPLPGNISSYSLIN
jgi:PBP1b-binding outer membrane lipoprotein LpoB